jgi:dipeptide transport system ATP-binding protein
MALLNVDKLSVHFGDVGSEFRAVDRISYSVNQGEVVGIVGESGSGKSVSSLAIMGLIDYPGRVMAENLEFNGRDLKRISEKERRQLVGAEVAMIFQDPMTSLNPATPSATRLWKPSRCTRAATKKRVFSGQLTC